MSGTHPIPPLRGVATHIAVAFILTCVAPSRTAAAPPKLDWLYPAGAARGSTMTITAGGADAWPVKVWLDDDSGVTIEAHKDKGKLEVTIAADATPGIRWLRLYNDQGASPLRPFVIGTLPDMPEKETNDVEPQLITESSIIHGRLIKRNDLDAYAIDLKQGQTLIAAMDANESFGSPMDGVLQLCDADGFVIEQNDDTRGLDPRIVYTVPRDGRYIIRAFAFPAQPNSSIGFAGDADYIYRLTLTTGGFVDHVLPSSARRDSSTEVALHGWNIPSDAQRVTIDGAKDRRAAFAFHPAVADAVALAHSDHAIVVASDDASPSQPQALALPCVVSGRVASPNAVAAFRFAAKKGQAVRLRVESRALASPLDPVVRVFDGSGKEIADKDDAGRSTRDAALDFSPPADGDYTIHVYDLHRRGGFRFVYRLTAEPVTPDVALSPERDTFVLAAGKTIEVSVKIDRRDGYDKEFTVRIDGLPEGVEAEAVKSTAKGGAAKAVTLKIKAPSNQAAWSGPIRIIADLPDGARRVATFGAPGEGASHTDAWLTVTATGGGGAKP